MKRGQEDLFHTNPDLVDILDRMYLDFDNFFSFLISNFQVPKFWISGLSRFAHGQPAGGRTDGRTDRRTDGWAIGRTYGRADGRMDRLTGRRTDVREGLMCGRMDGRTY